jgi:transcriptional regulator with XRE-family HTH domain
MIEKSFMRKLISDTGYEDYEKLAHEIGASQKSIYKWMNGTSEPSAEHFYQLLQLAGYLSSSSPEMHH